MPDGSIQEEVNNRVYELTLEHRATQSEFLCECVDVPCSAFVSLTLDQFERLRVLGTPILAKGHQPPESFRPFHSAVEDA